MRVKEARIGPKGIGQVVVKEACMGPEGIRVGGIKEARIDGVLPSV